MSTAPNGASNTTRPSFCARLSRPRIRACLSMLSDHRNMASLYPSTMYCQTFFASLAAKHYDRASEGNRELAHGLPRERWAQGPSGASVLTFLLQESASRRQAQTKRPPFGGSFCLSALSWRLATFPFRVSSLQRGLTAVFGMGTGVTLSPNHQDTALKLCAHIQLASQH